jgi:hypothetical protein
MRRDKNESLNIFWGKLVWVMFGITENMSLQFSRKINL